MGAPRRVFIAEISVFVHWCGKMRGVLFVLRIGTLKEVLL